MIFLNSIEPTLKLRSSLNLKLTQIVLPVLKALSLCLLLLHLLLIIDIVDKTNHIATSSTSSFA